MVTKRGIPGDKLIWWYQGRCGKAEEIYKVMKEDLAGGHLPSARFGVNTAWWGIMVLAFNLNPLMKRLVLPEGWASKRLKAIRFGFINLACRVMNRAQQLIIHLCRGHPAYALLMETRRRLKALWNSDLVFSVVAPP